jgi:hypothetical protein
MNVSICYTFLVKVAQSKFFLKLIFGISNSLINQHCTINTVIVGDLWFDPNQEPFLYTAFGTSTKNYLYSVVK